MSLNEVPLSPFLITQMYSLSLNLETKSVGKSAKKVFENTMQNKEIAGLKYLGNNEKNILIVVAYEGIANLPDEQLDFLTQLLSACKLSLNDVALINLRNYTGIEYTEILLQFHSKVILLFGISAQQFGFPFETPQYQVQVFTNYTVIHAPALQNLQTDKSGKGLLWSGLKKVFNI